MNLTHRSVSGTGSTDGETAEMTPARGSESPNPPSIGTINATGKAVKAYTGIGKIGVDDDENGGSADGRKGCGAVERKDNSTGRTDDEEVDVNDGEKDMEEERINEGKS